MNLIKTLFGGGSAAVSPEQVTEHLKSCLDPNTGKDLVSAKAIKNLKIDGGRVSLDVVLGYPARSQWAALAEQVRAQQALVATESDRARLASLRFERGAAQRGVALLPGVKNIIAIASGKGGVGKSTTTVNLALALAAEGARVGILDADIYGPSQPLLLGLQGRRPESPDNKSLLPLESLGVQSMSIGYLVEDDNAMIWRGPMVMSAITQMLRDVAWGTLDVLVVDMPPGTGDGIVENMAAHVCSNCGHVEHIFGADGGKKMAAEYGMDYLGALPLNMSIRLQADSGKPTVVADPDGEVAQIYKKVARDVAVKIAQQAKDFSSKFPTISISKNT